MKVHGGCHYTAKDEKKVDEEIDELERKIKAVSNMNIELPLRSYPTVYPLKTRYSKVFPRKKMTFWFKKKMEPVLGTSPEINGKSANNFY